MSTYSVVRGTCANSVFVGSIKLGVIEDPSNRSRLAKLLRFHSSRGDSMTFLADYVARMKPNQNHIYYIAGSSRAEVTTNSQTCSYIHTTALTTLTTYLMPTEQFQLD